jgi:glycerate kinase
MHILIAPNAFKNSLTADKAAEAISKGLGESKLKCTVTSFPVGDGGDGTGRLLIQHLSGKTINKEVNDPVGRKINSSFGFIENGQVAIIELADASGLRLLQKNEYDPLHATTFGTGELVKEALKMNAKKIILCIGGSASVDAGAGILQALGIRFFNTDGNELKQLPASLKNLAAIDTSALDNLFQYTELIILCDVENYLLGKEGAAAVFGPQKGATKEIVLQLEEGLAQFRNIALEKTGKDMALLKHGGAAGGVAAGLNTFLNAKLVNGIDYFLDITGFNQLLLNADLVITGEGSIDVQTLHGKGPFGVAARAKQRSIPVIGLGGVVTHSETLQQYFDRLIPINRAADIEIAMKETYRNLVLAAKGLGEELNIHSLL